MNPLVKLLMAIPLAAFASFSVFGFLASFETGVNVAVWATGYGIAGLASASGAIALCWSAVSRRGIQSKSRGG